MLTAKDGGNLVGSSTSLARFNEMMQAAGHAPVAEDDWQAFCSRHLEPLLDGLGDDIQPEQYFMERGGYVKLYVEGWMGSSGYADYVRRRAVRRQLVKSGWEVSEWVDTLPAQELEQLERSMSLSGA